MKKKILIALGVIVLLGGGALLGVHFGGQYVAETVVLPRIQHRLGANIEWNRVRSSLSDIRIEGIVVRFEGIEELALNVDSVQVQYELWSLLHGDVELSNVRINQPNIEFSEINEQTIRSIRQKLDELTGETNSEPGESSSRSSMFSLENIDSIRVEQGAINVESIANRTIRVEGIDASLANDGHIAARISQMALSQVGSDGNILRTDAVRLSASQEARRRFTIGEIDIEGVHALWNIGAEDNPLEVAAREIRNLFRGEGEASAEREQATSSVDHELIESWPTSISIANSQIDLSVPLSEDERREISLEQLDGRIFLGTNDSPPGADLTGTLSPGDGQFSINAGLSTEGLPRAQIRIQEFNIGQLAGDLSLSGVELEEDSVFDSDITVERNEDGSFGFRGEFSTDAVTVQGRLIASEPLQNLRLRALAQGVVNFEPPSVELEMGRFWINGIETRISGSGAREGEHSILNLRAELMPVGCGVLKEAVPPALREDLDDLQLDGTISGSVEFEYDSESIEDLVLNVDVRNRCEAHGTGRLSIDRLQGAFTHRVELPDDEVYEFRTGPGSGSWASFSQISPFMIGAVLTTEDGRFYHHNGFNLREIRRALIRDLNAGRPAFGASTISMQLARNIWLYRSRTLARKIQEAVLTWYLEENLSKDEIMTLYLNIIEFGPRIFGLRHAAMHYFGRQPDDLSPREAMFLAKLLPSPVRGHEDTYEEGELSRRWRSRVDRALRVMRDRRSITQDEYQAAISQRIVFYNPGDPLPAHRSWRARGTFLRSRGIVSDDPPERWLEVDTEAVIPAPPELLDQFE